MVLKKMDNGGYKRDAEEGTALELVTSTAANCTTANGNGTSCQPSTTCKTDVCQNVKRNQQPPDLSGSPWHKYKTVALITFIVLFIIWIIVYTVCSQLKLV